MVPPRLPIVRPRPRGSLGQRRLCALCRRSRLIGPDHPQCAPTSPCPWSATAEQALAIPVGRLAAGGVAEVATLPGAGAGNRQEPYEVANEEASAAAGAADVSGASGPPASAAITATSAGDARTEPSQSVAVLERRKVPRRRNTQTARGGAPLPAETTKTSPIHPPQAAPPYVSSGAA